MSAPLQPPVDPRRRQQFAAELLARARAWIADWELDPAARGFGRALFEIAARYDAEVAERLDRSGEKNTRGLLDWLGMQGEAAQAARMPVVLRLAASAPDPVSARAPVKLRAESADSAAGAIMFETESDVTLVPGGLAALVAVDPAADAFYLPPPGIEKVEPAPAQPDAWRTRAYAAGGAAQLQLEPELGLEAGMLVEIGGLQYRLAEVNKDIVALDPPLAADAGLAAQSPVTRVKAFVPFGAGPRSRQRHALYIGDAELLNIDAAASIDIGGAGALPPGVRWEYWGVVGEGKDPDWQRMDPPQAQQDGSARLSKPKGAIAQRKVGQAEGRWIRAVLDKAELPVAFDQLTLAINGEVPENCPFGTAGGPGPALEGVANAAPQVLDGVFYPFGREPRQFDTFYLGCAEAFSKKKATVALCFDLADPTMKALTLVPFGPVQAPVLAATGMDGYLHLLTLDRQNGKVAHLRPPLQPPSPKDPGAKSPESPVPLDRPNGGVPIARPAAWTAGDEFFVAVAASPKVWVWHERLVGGKAGPQSGWLDYGQAQPASSENAKIADLLAAGGLLFLLLDGGIQHRPRTGDAPWELLKLATDTPPVPATLAPVLALDANMQLDRNGDRALCAVSDKGEAFLIWFDRSWQCVPGLPKLNKEVRPLAFLQTVDTATVRLGLVAVEEDRTALVSFMSAPFPLSSPGDLAGDADRSSTLPGPVTGRDLDIGIFENEITVCASTASSLLAWTPFARTLLRDPVILPINAELGAAGGGPVVLGTTQIVVPGTRSDLLVGSIASIGLIGLSLDAGAFRDALVTEAAQALAEGDTLAVETVSGKVELAVIDGGRIDFEGKAIHPLKTALTGTPSGQYRLYKTSQAAHPGQRTGEERELKIDEHDAGSGYLLMKYAKSRKENPKSRKENPITDHSGTGAIRIAHFGKDLPDGVGEVSYWPALQVRADIQPLLAVGTADSRKWEPYLLRQQIHFPGSDPEAQPAKVIHADRVDSTLLLGAPWKKRPAGTVEAYIDSTELSWSRQLGETANNPELSWEYWNGSGWWKLVLEKDSTANFQLGGMVKFTVPADLQPSEWVGKSNFWIRARLVGGDYGRETVSATTAPGPGANETTQWVTRDTSTIHAPAVLHVELRYALKPAVPQFVLTEDSAATRDQSDANRADGAIVEAFVPLAAMLGRLDAVGAGQDTAGAPCCGAGAAAPDGASAVQAGGRALYLGFDGRLVGDAVNILMLASVEQDFDALAPARVDVLRGTRFEPVVASDGTRALGETGILSLALASAPAPAELFGQSLAWLRIRPRAGADDAAWNPALAGAYLNAVWARAAESQDFEMLGSSDGSPLQEVLLARPPVLRDSLELRVREPLGEEERLDLLRLDPASVARADGQQGDWVLWQRVADPADEGAGARVYWLDEASGAIRFGDGVHGAVPPIGRDAIMAFHYRRSDAAGSGGGPSPANAVKAGSTLGIVTAVESAEAAFAADQAAGGSPADDVERILRLAPARLRQRRRAVTAADLEQMALALQPEAAQARCLAAGAATRLVLVMRGENPMPSRAVRRELRRLLLAAGAPGLAAPGALQVDGPRLRPFQVQVTLSAATLEHSVTLAGDSRLRLRAFFDPAAGGRAGEGWRLGEVPDETDVAACLLGIAGLDGIAAVTLSGRAAAGAPVPLPARLGAGELAVLAPDGIELRFTAPGDLP